MMNLLNIRLQLDRLAYTVELAVVMCAAKLHLQIKIVRESFLLFTPLKKK
jgi:hypothetical protein